MFAIVYDLNTHELLFEMHDPRMQFTDRPEGSIMRRNIRHAFKKQKSFIRKSNLLATHLVGTFLNTTIMCV